MTLRQQAEQFITNPPYRESPYSARNWGGKWHSLCSYHGKLKPAIAHFLISEFTNAGDVVLDPLCGVGTIPFEACQQGRIGIGNDLSRLAYVVTKAKIEPHSENELDEEMARLSSFVADYSRSLDIKHLPYSTFGFNKTLSEYFEPRTFAEILAAREYFKKLNGQLSSEQSLIMAAILHVLHGNRPYALSRRSHPLTPYAPTGDYEYKNLIEHAKKKILMTISEPLSDEFIAGSAIFGDYSDLHGINANAIITSPPFAGSLRFYMQNWMRLWFSGWEPEDYCLAEGKFLDAKQSKDMSIYKSFFETCYKNLAGNGLLILHLGKNKKTDMAEEMKRYCKDCFEVVYCADEDVTAIEKHGIADKGGITQHQYLFLQKI